MSKEQDQYMIEEKCTNNLEIIKPNIWEKIIIKKVKRKKSKKRKYNENYR
jgi:hypothetical protein